MKTILTALAMTLAAGPALADDAAMDRALLGYQEHWARINYTLPADQKAAAFETLAKQEDALVKSYPNRAEPLVWQGIILSSLAGAERSLGALGLAKQARADLLASEKIDPAALHGSAEASLGTLYYRVPGWPIGFGDDDKAEVHFKNALQIDPDGIDTNYLYADFLYGKHRYPEAMQALKKAWAAPARPDRPLADKGRRQEIAALMAKVKEKAGGSLKAAEL